MSSAMLNSSVWESIAEDATEASKLVYVLIVRYLSMMTSEHRLLPFDEVLRRVGAGDANILIPTVRVEGLECRRDTLCRLLATLYFVVTFFRLDVHYSPLRVAMVKWKAFGAAGLVGIEQSAMFSVKVRALVQRKLFGGGTNFAEQDLRVLLNDLTTIGTDDKRLLPVNTPLDATCTSLLSALIARHVASSDASDVLSIVMNRLRKDVSDGTFVVVSCLIRRQLVSTPFLDPALLEDAFRVFRNFLLWPRPFCTITVDLLRTLSMETKSPGVTWRHNLETFFPFLLGGSEGGGGGGGGSMIKSKSGKLGSAAASAARSSGRELEVNLFTSTDDPNLALSYLLESVSMEIPSERAVLVAIISSLFRCLEVTDEGSDEDNVIFTKLGLLSMRKLAGLYAKLRDALEQALKLATSEEAMAYLVGRSEQLYKAAAKHIGRELQKRAAEEGVPEEAIKPTVKSASLVHGIPFQYKVTRLSLDCTLAGREMGTKWPRRNLHKPFRELVADAIKYAEESKGRSGPFPVRIVVEGGDLELHHVLSSYVFVIQSEPYEKLKKLRFHFYLVPTNKRPSFIAGYLSAMDPWFAKSVAVMSKALTALHPRPFADGFDLAPSSASATTVKMTPSDAAFSIPAFVGHSMMSDYMTLATHRNEMRVFQCECWQKSVSSSVTDNVSKYIIPFMCNAEVGVAAQVREFRLRQLLPSTLPVEDIVACKAFKFRPPVLSVKLTLASNRDLGKPEVLELDVRAWHEIYMGLLSRPGEPCDPPRVGATWLEVYACPAGDVLGGVGGGGSGAGSSGGGASSSASGAASEGGMKGGLGSSGSAAALGSGVTVGGSGSASSISVVDKSERGATSSGLGPSGAASGSGAAANTSSGSGAASGSNAGAAGAKKKSRRNPDGTYRGYKYHVRSMEIEGHNKSTFEICLDGAVYGPFSKVVISPCVFEKPDPAEAQDAISFPLMSFSNIEKTE